MGLRQAEKPPLTPRPHFTAPSCTLGNQVVGASDGPPVSQERRPTRVCGTPGAGGGLLAEASTPRTRCSGLPCSVSKQTRYESLESRSRFAAPTVVRVTVCAGVRRAPPSGVVTFLFTDIEGSTRRWEADADSKPGCRIGDQDLAAVTGAHHPRGSIERRTEVVSTAAARAQSAADHRRRGGVRGRRS